MQTLNLVLTLTLLCYANIAFAEYYYQCRQSSPEVVRINCKGHQCHWRTQHVTRMQAYPRVHETRHVARAQCNQDMATGDDNACRSPELEIN